MNLTERCERVLDLFVELDKEMEKVLNLLVRQSSPSGLSAASAEDLRNRAAELRRSWARECGRKPKSPRGVATEESAAPSGEAPAVNSTTNLEEDAHARASVPPAKKAAQGSMGPDKLPRHRQIALAVSEISRPPEKPLAADAPTPSLEPTGRIGTREAIAALGIATASLPCQCYFNPDCFRCGGTGRIEPRALTEEDDPAASWEDFAVPLPALSGPLVLRDLPQPVRPDPGVADGFWRERAVSNRKRRGQKNKSPRRRRR